MKVKPLGDRILIKIQESENKTAGGIIIPQTAWRSANKSEHKMQKAVRRKRAAFSLYRTKRACLGGGPSRSVP